MISIKTLFIVAAIIYYIYSNIKGIEAQKNKKSTANPTPSQKSTLDELLGKMLEQQNRKGEEVKKPETNANTNAPKKIFFKPKEPVMKPTGQGLPFEKRKLSDAREMPSRKQIEKVVLREKKATEQPEIKVKDYDIDFVNHDQPHLKHTLAEKSNIHFSFKEKEKEHYEFDARQAIIAQIILERKEY